MKAIKLSEVSQIGGVIMSEDFLKTELEIKTILSQYSQSGKLGKLENKIKILRRG